MAREAAKQATGESLFRESAVKAAGHRLFGSVTAVMPPSATAALCVAILTGLALVTAGIVVEVPLRVRAVGVLMPPGGFLNLIAVESGQVARVHAADGQHVRAGELLVEIAANGTNLPGESLSELRLRSLRSELELLDDAHARQQDIARARLSALAEELDVAIGRLLSGRRQLDAQQAQLEILQTTVARMRDLAQRGHIARDPVDREHAALLIAGSREAELEQRLAGLELEMNRVAAKREETQRQIELEHTQYRIEKERLTRQVTSAEYQLVQGIRAPADSLVARILVRAGAPVNKGQVVAKLYHPTDGIEAWLYLSSSTARLLRTGQTVQLRLDAYPKEVFGTRTAVVSHVSAVALLPSEVSVPLTLGGPVFEVRAELREEHLSAYGSEWPLLPGTAFQADVVQRRFRLYEWLLRSLIGDTDGAHA